MPKTGDGGTESSQQIPVVSAINKINKLQFKSLEQL